MQLLSNDKKNKVAFKIKPILSWLFRQNVAACNPIADPLIAHWLLHPDSPNIDKHTVLSLAGEHLPTKQFDMEGCCVMYNQCQASVCCLELWRTLRKQLQQQELERWYRRVEMPTLRVLAQMEVFGVGIDTAHQICTTQRVTDKLILINSFINTQAGLSVNINSSNEVKLFLETVKNKDQIPFFESIISEFRRLHRLRSQWLRGICRHFVFNPLLDSVRIHSSFELFTGTGRIKSQAPNLQATPHPVDFACAGKNIE